MDKSKIEGLHLELKNIQKNYKPCLLLYQGFIVNF
jgi:hypothetical protein